MLLSMACDYDDKETKIFKKKSAHNKQDFTQADHE